MNRPHRTEKDAIDLATAAHLAATSEAHPAANPTTGSVLHVVDDPAFARLKA